MNTFLTYLQDEIQPNQVKAKMVQHHPRQAAQLMLRSVFRALKFALLISQALMPKLMLSYRVNFVRSSIRVSHLVIQTYLKPATSRQWCTSAHPLTVRSLYTPMPLHRIQYLLQMPRKEWAWSSFPVDAKLPKTTMMSTWRSLTMMRLTARTRQA